MQLQFSVGKRGDAFGVTNANFIARDREIGVNPMLVSQESAHVEQSSAAHCGQALDFEPVLVEFQRAMQLAQAVGQVLKRQCTVLEFNAALQAGVFQGTVRFNLEGCDSRSQSGRDRGSRQASD